MTSVNERPDPLTARGIKLQGEYFADCNLLVDIIAKDMEAYKELEQQVKELVAQVDRLRSAGEDYIYYSDDISSPRLYANARENMESALSETPHAALAALKAQLRGEIVKEFL